MASCAISTATPSISKRILPGRTTATQWSSAPLPEPMRTSAGFLVIGLSGNSRTQILPPRLTKRVIAIRLASICRSVMYPHSRTFKPYSPNDSVEPRHALPRRLPFCCLRNFTFFGINITKTLKNSSQFVVLSSQFSVRTIQLAATCCELRTVNDELPLKRRLPDRRGLAAFLLINVAAIDPHLHADNPIRRLGLGKSIVDIGAQRVQRQTPLQIPLRARDFIAVQAARDAHLDSLAAEAQCRVHALAH